MSYNSISFHPAASALQHQEFCAGVTTPAKAGNKTCCIWFNLHACSLPASTQKRPYNRGAPLGFPSFGSLLSCSDSHEVFGVGVAMGFSVSSSKRFNSY